MWVKFFTIALMLVCGQSNSGLAEAAGVPPRLPVADFMRQPGASAALLSPSGAYVGMLIPSQGRKALVVMKLADRSVRLAASDPEQSIENFRWVNDRRLAFSLGDPQAAKEAWHGGGMFAVDLDGKNFKVILPMHDLLAFGHVGDVRYQEVVRTYTDGREDMLVISNEHNRDHPQLFHVDTGTARLAIVSGGIPGEVSHWVLDKDEKVRAAVRVETRDGRRVHQFVYRDSVDAPWSVLHEWTGWGDVIEPVAFSADEKEILVFSNIGRDTVALFAFDLTKRKLGELLVGHPKFDLSEALQDPVSNEVVGVRYQGEIPSTIWFDDGKADLQKKMDAALPDRINDIVSFAGGSAVIKSYSDRDPGHFYLWDGERKRLEELFPCMDWIDPEQMARMKAIEYVARDGVRIPAYLTLPVGKEQKMLPLVVMPHGGPFGVRDVWRWGREVQFLANRGYAVLQPQFRGSGGYGRKHLSAGFKQWGKAMQDDLTDGVKYLISQGSVDPKRVAIVGAHYGGYAALAGGAFASDVYSGVVSRSGLSDISMMFHPHYQWEFHAERWYDFDAHDMIGDPGKDAAQIRATSPVHYAANFRVPVLLTHGRRDINVVPEQAQSMESALISAGKSVELILFDGEGHELNKESNRVAEWTKIEAYLKQQLGE